MPGHTKCCTHHAKSSQQTWRSDAPKRNPSQIVRKSAPGPPNSSDEHVSCIAPATEHATLQILFTCSTPAIVFGNATKHPFCSRLTRCAIPCACHAKRHLNVKKWSAHVMFLTCLLRNVLRATTACTFSTSQLPKVLWGCSVLYILTWKCASRHNSVQFFISHLASWLRTRRFSESTVRPCGATNHWKNTVFRDFPTFSRTWILFLQRLSLFDLLSSSLLFSDSAHLCFFLSILSEVWLLNFLRLCVCACVILCNLNVNICIYIYRC